MHFISPKKSYLFLRYFKSYSEFSKHTDNKTDAHFKIYYVSAGKQIITIHILSNISKSEDHQTIKFVQLHCVKIVQISSFFWSVFSRIRTGYGQIRSISPYSVRMRENTDQKKLLIWTLFTQLIEINMKNIFLETHTRSLAAKLLPNPFLKN